MMTWRVGPGVGPDGLTWQRADVERGTTVPLRRGTEATWQDACRIHILYNIIGLSYI